MRMLVTSPTREGLPRQCELFRLWCSTHGKYIYRVGEVVVIDGDKYATAFDYMDEAPEHPAHTYADASLSDSESDCSSSCSSSDDE